ncbi:MAG TPA: penicillin-binding transpeptidase domain-containing protein [Candidatus Deferrimicrobium sp.]|nr:penicillin-binding transpeptidase domain-containing protein [Candidatus Deferrimicrobium sp.]
MSTSIKRAVLGLTLCFCILSFGLVYWQLINSEELLGKPGNLRAIYQEQKIWRGGIFDRNGEILAKSCTDAEAETLLKKKVKPSVKPPEDGYPPQIRVYPKGDLFTHIVGTYSFIYGKSGLEDSLNKTLLGLGPGESIQSLTQQVLDTPRKGNDVVLTLDTKIQTAGVNGLRNKFGAAVAIEPKTGKILAMVSAPTFNPNELDQKYKEIEAGGNQVFYDKAISTTYTPGSTMKLVTAGALLRAGLDINAVYQDSGKDRVEAKGESREVVDQIYNARNEGHGPVDFTRALALSCNTYFATRAAMVGDAAFLDATRRYGFGQPLPLGEVSGDNNPIKVSKINQNGIPSKLKLGELMDSAYGQGQVQVTPLHMAMITGAIANGGKMMRPGVVERVINPKQEVAYQYKPQEWLTPLSPQEAAEIKTGMVGATEYGTASELSINGVAWAAKTGSAELGGDNQVSDGWFVAFAPAEDPIIAVAVIVEHGKYGATSAGPIARDMILAALSERR